MVLVLYCFAVPGGQDPGDLYYTVYRYSADLEGRILGNVSNARCVASI
jgi:hypothetical protein